VVVPVPLAAAVQRDQQEVRSLQRRQHLPRSGGVEDRVAQRPAHALQDRGPGQERHPLRRELCQQLGVQVVGDEPVVPGERQPAAPWGAAGLEGQRGQVQPDRPPLGPDGQLGHLRIRKLDIGGFEQRAGLPRVHGQLLHSNLHELAMDAQQGHREGWCAP
jgi:hypothetical protein